MNCLNKIVLLCYYPSNVYSLSSAFVSAIFNSFEEMSTETCKTTMKLFYRWSC